MTEAKAADLLSCPFCDEPPYFSDAEYKDDRRYVAMTLNCSSCSVEMSEALTFSQYRTMTHKQISERMKQTLATCWNTRVLPS